MTKIMHDQEMMDILLEQFGEEASMKFGDCISYLNVPLAPELFPQETFREMVDVVNQTLESVGSQMRVHTITGSDVDGYFWEVSE